MGVQPTCQMAWWVTLSFFFKPFMDNNKICKLLIFKEFYSFSLLLSSVPDNKPSSCWPPPVGFE